MFFPSRRRALFAFASLCALMALAAATAAPKIAPSKSLLGVSIRVRTFSATVLGNLVKSLSADVLASRTMDFGDVLSGDIIGV